MGTHKGLDVLTPKEIETTARALRDESVKTVQARINLLEKFITEKAYNQITEPAFRQFLREIYTRLEELQARLDALSQGYCTCIPIKPRKEAQ